MIEQLRPRAIGAPNERVDGRAKVLGTAPYAFEHAVSHPAYLYPLRAGIPRGRVTGIDTAAAEALDGVLAVLTPANAGRLAPDADPELAVLQSDEVAFHGQFVGAVLADSPEVARHAASRVAISYAVWSHDAGLRADADDLYTPAAVNAGFATDTATGDVDAAMASAAVTLDRTYRTPMAFNNPMEPHTTVASWDDDGLLLYDSTQGVHTVRRVIASVFGLDPGRIQVIAPHVGGGFGSKGTVHAHVVLAALAARHAGGRPVKFALTRQQMFSLAGYRTPTVQRIRLAADADGRLAAVAHDVIEQTSRFKEFAEQTAAPSRVMYAAANRRTSHRLAPRDVPVPSWMRAPGECPGMYALESAMDEMADACGLDPIEFRIRNEPDADPDTGLPFSSRNLVACLRDGARRFGWAGRDPIPGGRWENGRLVGTGVAAATYPTFAGSGSAASIEFDAGRYRVRIGAADIGTGTWTTLTQIAADALDVSVDAVDLRIGDSTLPAATVAGGSMGITNWGSTIVAAAGAFRDRHGTDPASGARAEAEMPDNPDRARFAMHAFGAYFAEVHVHGETGEVRVPRMLGVFAAGRIINPRTARSQFLGGMTMGLSMALHEEGVMDPRFGHVVNQDFAEYHIATNADIGALEAHWLDEYDPHVNPMGSKGIGEIGIVGSAAAIANAVHHATGIRVRDLPITCDKLLRPQ